MSCFLSEKKCQCLFGYYCGNPRNHFSASVPHSCNERFQCIPLLRLLKFTPVRSTLANSFNVLSECRFLMRKARVTDSCIFIITVNLVFSVFYVAWKFNFIPIAVYCIVYCEIICLNTKIIKCFDEADIKFSLWLLCTLNVVCTESYT